MNLKTSLNPKVHQRAVNRVLRDVNKNIENDELWQGRFFIRQWARQVVTYEDHSGMLLYLELRFYDKKTKKFIRYFCDSLDVIAWGGSRIFYKMNDFIVLDLDVWRNEDPRNERFDWRTIPAEKIIKTATNLKEDWIR